MLVQSVLEPSVLHIDRATWRDNIQSLETRWLEFIDGAREAEDAGCKSRVLLSDELLALVWDEEHGTAWALEPDLRPRLLPIFLRSLQPMLSLVPDLPEESADLTPPMNERSAEDPWQAQALKLLSWALRQQEDVLIQVGAMGSDVECTTAALDGSESRVLTLCHSYLEYLYELPLKNMAENATAESEIAAVVKIASKRLRREAPEDSTPIAVFECTDRFRDDYRQAPAGMRFRIVDAMSQRITLTQSAASRHSGLRDKAIKGRRGWRRLRVSDDWRIHYTYVESMIRFETVGPHDLGLR